MNSIATSPDCDYFLQPWAALRATRRLLGARPWRRALLSFTSPARFELGSVTSFEPGCVVADDPGEVVRGAKPITSDDRDRMREQHILRLMADYRRQTN